MKKEQKHRQNRNLTMR